MDLTLSCHCGRTMTHVDSALPPGKYRCGCGWSVRVSRSKNPAHCIGERRDGRPCAGKVRITRPVPLCMKHLEQLAKSGVPAFDTAIKNASVMRDIQRDHEQAAYEKREEKRRRHFENLQREREEDARARSVVYYVRIGEYIKIGTTINFKERMGSLLVDEVLATEPGGRQQESIRLRQFADLRVRRREYFRPDRRLLEHIEEIRQRHGEPEALTTGGS